MERHQIIFPNIETRTKTSRRFKPEPKINLVINKHHHKNSIPSGAINIMRGSVFGNPFVIGVDGDRAEVIEKFRVYLWGRLKSEPEFAEKVSQLHGQVLCCCCAPAPCHGDVLVRAAAYLNQSG